VDFRILGMVLCGVSDTWWVRVGGFWVRITGLGFKIRKSASGVVYCYGLWV
jgi:hypothetical protein